MIKNTKTLTLSKILFHRLIYDHFNRKAKHLGHSELNEVYSNKITNKQVQTRFSKFPKWQKLQNSQNKQEMEKLTVFKMNGKQLWIFRQKKFWHYPKVRQSGCKQCITMREDWRDWGISIACMKKYRYLNQRLRMHVYWYPCEPTSHKQME